MSPSINCENQNPVVPHWNNNQWVLVPLSEIDASDTPHFQFASTTCYTTGTPETINGFTYGEVFLGFFLIVFSMALIFNFIFTNFIKNN